MVSPQRFKVRFPPAIIDDLQRRLAGVRWPGGIIDPDWRSGTNHHVLRQLVRHWRQRYDWRLQQQRINALPHFRVTLAGEQLHFVHRVGRGERQPFPLLLLHGWPGSFLQFELAAPLLMQGRRSTPGFDLVIPTLPGFPFSEARTDRSLHYKAIARKMHQLMRVLGYRRFGVSGGDWGWLIAREMALQNPTSVVGLHLEHQYPLAQLPSEGRDREERVYLRRRGALARTGLAYNQLQSTKPSTLAYALQDSPVGFLSWILEKFWEWSDHGDDLWETLDRDFVITTAMLYWGSRSIASSARLYYVNNLLHKVETRIGTVQVPTRWSRYPKDPFEGVPESLMDRSGFRTMECARHRKGGHFPSVEQPELWAKDVGGFFARLGRDESRPGASAR
jgi:epoxide hydrolase